VKSLGATEVLDYSDPQKCSEEIKRISGGGVSIGLDTISEGKSWEISLNAFKGEGGRLNGILPPSEEVKEMGEEKKVEVSNTLMYTLFGRVCGLPAQYQFNIPELMAGCLGIHIRWNTFPSNPS